MHWVLILTILNSGINAVAATNFESESACLEAGERWQKQAKDNLGGTPVYLCAKTYGMPHP